MGVSDHSLIYAAERYHISKTSPTIGETRNFKHYKTLEFKRDLSIALSNCDWSTRLMIQIRFGKNLRIGSMRFPIYMLLLG